MEFIALDLETTGLDPLAHEIIEIGLVRFSAGEPQERRAWLVRPERPLPPEGLAVSGISREELARAPRLVEVLPGVLEELAGATVVAHNAPFDRAFLAAAARRLGLRLPRARWVDTLALARALWPRRSGYSLAALKKELGLPGQGHRALPDAEAAGWVFLALLSRLSSLPREELVRLSSQLPESVWQLVAPGELEAAFSALERTPGFVRRSAQRAFAQAALAAFREGRFALLEAGPGTGKTFGYLVPLLLALEEGGRAVVATRTRALQEQLWCHDLPTALRALGLDLPVALLKGRENYLCLRRLEELRLRLVPEADPGPLFSWAAHTTTGDLDELPELAATPEGRRLLAGVRDVPLACSGPACPFFRTCPSRRAREAARKAALVVANHALLGADLAWEGRILGQYDYLVVDEAHGLPEALRDALSLEFSPHRVPRLLGELSQLPLGRGGELERLRARLAVVHREFWDQLSPSFPEEPAAYGREDMATPDQAQALVEALNQLATWLGEEADRREGEVAERARALAQEAVRLSRLAEVLVQQSLEDYVYWWQRGPAGPALYASPVELAPHVAGALWPGLRGAVLTSATLAVGGKPEHLVRELGIPHERVVFRRWPAPFSYEGVRAFVLDDLPLPDAPDYPAALARLIEHVLGAVPRRALVLFTSRRLLRTVRELITRVPALAQGVDGEREGLLSRFREHPPPVALLGLDTMWEGVDLPGEELELLFITRLPFPVPTDPLAQAEAARLRTRGEDPFINLFLPRAVLKLRQGVGRLVRTPQDRGAIIITDGRAASRPYGARFLAELPVPARTVSSTSLAGALQELF